MAEPFLGQIILVGFTFAPRGYALCNGQIMSIAQNTALFSLLGTTYGGNGQTTFALPDLRGRVPNHFGQGPGLSNYTQGEVAGQETVTLTTAQMPMHNHVASAAPPIGTLNATSVAGNTRDPANALPAREASGVTATYNNVGGPTVPMAANAVALTAGAVTVQNAGSSLPVSILPPFLTLNYCIAIEGIFPSRN
jgi:microcystin-dependent protein